MHFGRLISKLKKSLSPVIIISTFEVIAAFRMVDLSYHEFFV